MQDPRRVRRHASHDVFASKRSCAAQQNRDEGNHVGNGDVHPDVFFTKSLPHDPSTGSVDDTAFARMRRALSCDDVRAWQQVPVGVGCSSALRLCGPSAAGSFELDGPAPQSIGLPAPPRISTPHAAADLGEAYLMYVCRDLPFTDYASSAMAERCARRLNRMTGYIGPRVRRGHAGRYSVTPEVLFRGDTPGDIQGPYVSQFLLHPFSMITARFEQRYAVPVPGSDSMRSWDSAIAAQSGVVLDAPVRMSRVPRYIRNGRDLAWYVGSDVSFQPYQHAALVLRDLGAPFALSNPYRGEGNQISPGFNFGIADVFDALARAASCAAKAAWYHKWHVNGRLRPEAMAILVDRVLATDENPFAIHSDLLDSSIMSSIYRRNGNLLLPQVYVGGSPSHPSYPSGHAAVAGACATVLKAFYDEGWTFPTAYVPDSEGVWLDELPELTHALTLRGEVDKLASNIALGRNFAGVHYRSDAKGGWVLGERVATRLLQDLLVRYTESPSEGLSFAFHTRDGTRIVITP